MLKKINLGFLVGILFSIYMLQGFLYASGSIISQGILLLILAIGGFCLAGTLLRRNNPAPVVLFELFFLMLFFTYVISPKTQFGWLYEAIGEVSTFGQFKNTCAFSLLFFIGYYATIKCAMSRSMITILFFVQFITAIIMFFYTQRTLLMLLDREAVTVNAAYKFVVLIPFLSIVIHSIKNRLLLAGVIVSMASLIIMGSKRGAILCMLLSAVYALLYYVRHTHLNVKKIVGILFVIVVGSAFLLYSVEQNEYLTGRLEGMEESGIGTRNIAYSVLWNHWSSDSSLFSFLFGNGTASTIAVWGNYAHNDWLELLIDNGLLGVTLYFSLFLSFFGLIRRSLLSLPLKLSMYLCLLIWFLQTCFSMGYTDVGNGIYTLLLGVLTAKDVVIRKRNYTNNEDIVVD